jgi:DNA-binding NarL/FixJ family response regulator
MIRVIIADDHQVVRQGIRALLERAHDIQVIGEAGDGQEAIELVQRLEPDVVVMDISMPTISGIAALKRLRELETRARVVCLSMHASASLVRQALRSGASGYVLKRSVTGELLQAIRAASRGERYLCSAVLDAADCDIWDVEAHDATADPLRLLSSRELEVLHLIATGRTNNEMAEILMISPKTVEKHRATLMTKLKVRDVPGLMRIAFKHGLVFLDD